MFKAVLAASLLLFSGLSFAQAAEQNDSAPRRTYYMSWRFQDTGERVADWFKTNRPTCHHTNGCACNGQNFCGEYNEGESTYWFTAGCDNPPRVIYCDRR